MARCLYCHNANPAKPENCQRCGMPLPQQQEQRTKQRIEYIKWLIILLALLSAALIIWLPSSMPT